MARVPHTSLGSGQKSVHALAKSSSPCLFKSEHCWPGEAESEPEPEELPFVGVWAPLVGCVLYRKRPRPEPKNSGDVVHICGYRGGFVVAWAMQVLK